MATKSTHYELNLVTGTDKVNPLIYDVPNYEIIDGAMHENHLASVGTATELKSGSVHALTLADSGVKTFIFTATSDFVSGETFTVNGAQVTAYTTDSQPLTTNCYRIGTSVLAHLEGTILTVYVSSGSSSTAEDSEKLGGHTPDYFATASKVAEVDTLAQASAVVRQNALDKANAVESSLNARQNISMTVVDGELRITY